MARDLGLHEGGATEHFPIKSDKPSSNRFVDDFFATFQKTIIPSGVWMEVASECSAPGGTSIEAAILLLLK